MTPHRITIDMKKSGYKQFVNIRQAENESHIIYISLTNGTEPIKLDNDMVATVYLEGISKQWESCDIKDNEIVFTAPILNVGDTKCQIQLSNNNGYSISPTFIIVVENILNVPHFELLEEEPDDWIDNADSYYTFNGIDYVPVKFSSDRNLLKNLEFKTTDHSAGSIVYKRSQAISVSQGRRIYCTTTSNMLSITLKFEYKIGDNLSGNITTKEVDCKAQMPIVTPTITKRQYLENGYTDVVMYVVADSSYIDDNYKLTNTILEYDERTYINCNTPYFEKEKYYAMVNDYGNVGNSYNALIQALQEARTYYNKAIKDVSMIDNCLVITYNDNTQYKSGDLKGDGIARLDKSTDGNVDTYTFVTDKGNTFSFTVTNADNTKIDDLYTQLGYKTPLAVFNNEVAYIKELINDLDAKKESVEEHNKSISQLKNSLSIINTQLSILNNNKVEKDTYTTAIESLQSLVTKLQNSKVDTNTYNDEIANLTTAISELNDKQIDTNAIKESITELDTKKLNKEEFNQYKENVANTFANTDNDIKAVCDYVNSKLEVPLADIETLKSGKLDKTDFNSYKTSNDNAVNNKVNTTDFNAYKTATDKAVADNTKSIKANVTAIDKCVADIATNSAFVDDIKAYIGYTERDILGLQVDFENKTFTRLAGAVGLSAGADFDQFTMYGGRKRCNVSDDGTITAYYGDDNYAEDGSNGQVMVYQPKFYYLVCPVVYDPIDTGIGYHLRKANYYVSEKARAGFRLHPAFYDANGNELDYILIGAYEGSIYDTSASAYLLLDEQVMTVGEDKFCSIAGVKPASGLRQNLTRPNIETMAQNRGANWHLENSKIASMEQLLCMIEMGTMNFQTAIGQGVVSILDNGSYNCASLTGSTASLGNGTGRATETINEKGGVQTTETADGKTSVSYRGVENDWGNIWKFIIDPNIWGNGAMGGGEPFYCDDFNFAENKKTDNYKGAGFTVTNASGYISAMGYSTACDWLFMASECLGNSSVPVGDYHWILQNLNGYRIARLGGHWVNGYSAGGFDWYLGAGVGDCYRDIGGRLVYVPTATAKI